VKQIQFVNNLKSCIMNSNKYILCLLCFILCQNTEGYAQAAINTDGSPPSANTILDLNPAVGKAFIPPTMTWAQIKAISPAKEGMLAYDTDFKCLRMYTGSEWQCQQPNNKELTDPPGDFSVLAMATGAIYPQSTTTDAADNVYVIGFFLSTVTFGSTTLTNSGNYDVFVVKYNASGAVQWAVNGGGANDDRGSGIAVDGSGNVYVTGFFSSATATFGAITLTSSGSEDVYVAKYNASGVAQWAVKGGGASFDRGNGIAVDGSSNVYVTGQFSSATATFGSTTLTNTGGSDVFVVKYNTSGVVQWAVKGGGTSGDTGNGIAVDGSGNAYVTGQFSSTTATFGSTTLTNTGGSDVFVVKYNTSGVVQWAVNDGGTQTERVNSIAIDGSGNIYVTGFFSSATATFGAITLTSSGSEDVYVAKYNTSGVVQWAVKGSGTSSEVGYGISVDGSGNVYVTGQFSSTTATFGSTTLTNTGGSDVFVVKYNTFGLVQWEVKSGGTGNDFGFGIAVNASGTRVNLAVNYTPNAKFGNTILKTGSYLLWMYGE
jgi:hypothetical protein